MAKDENVDAVTLSRAFSQFLFVWYRVYYRRTRVDALRGMEWCTL